MIRHIAAVAKKEIFFYIYSVRFIFTMDLICILFLVSAYMMLSDYRQRRENFEAQRRMHQDHILDILDSETPRDQFRTLFWRGGISYDRTPAPMSVFVRGLDWHIPMTFTKSAWEAKQSNVDEYRNPILRLYMTPDFAYIVNIILSLLALLFVFDTISGEREDGTLNLLLSYPVPRAAVLLGKWIGGFITLLGPLFLGVLFWMIIIVNSGRVSFGPENIIRFFAVVGTSIVYLALFFSLGMVVSCLTRRSNTSLLVCFFVWVIWIIVIPNAAPIAAKAASPVPARREIEKLKEDIDEETERKIREVKKNILSYSDEGEQLEEEIRNRGENEKHTIEIFYDKRVKKQGRAARFLARLSPSGCYVFAVTAVAGTGFDAYYNTFRSFEKFENDFQDLYASLRRGWWRLSPGWLDRSKIPRLHFFSLRLENALNKAMFDVLLLCIFTVLFFMLSFCLFLTYDPR